MARRAAAKWRAVLARIDSEEETLAACRANLDACSPATRRLLQLAELGGESTGMGQRGVPAAGAGATEVDSLAPHRPGAPASRIHWPTVARTTMLMERRMVADALFANKAMLGLAAHSGYALKTNRDDARLVRLEK